MFSITDLAWCAGFLDAEGCFSRTAATAVLTISQTSVECLDVFMQIVGHGTINGPYDKATGAIKRKPQWIYYSYGNRAREVFTLLQSRLGEYRANQGSRVFRLRREPVPTFGDWPRSEQLAWAAGYFDGEGCFSKCGDSLNARITCTDVELLARFQCAVGLGKIYGPYAPHHTSFGRKPHFVLSINGFERVQVLLAMLWPQLGSAKRTKAVNLLRRHTAFWKCGHKRGSVWKRHCPTCFKPGPRPGFKSVGGGGNTIKP